jgi:hypothetical protein
MESSALWWIWRIVAALALLGSGALLLFCARWNLSVVPGAGPQGGEVAFLAFLMGQFGLIGVTVVHAWRLWQSLSPGGLGRALTVLVGGVLLTIALTGLFGAAADAPPGSGTRRVLLAAWILPSALLLVANAWRLIVRL